MPVAVRVDFGVCLYRSLVRVSRCPYSSLLVPGARTTRSYSCVRYLVFAPTRPLLVATVPSYLPATRARRVPVPVGARGCAALVPLLLCFSLPCLKLPDLTRARRAAANPGRARPCRLIKV